MARCLAASGLSAFLRVGSNSYAATRARGDHGHRRLGVHPFPVAKNGLDGAMNTCDCGTACKQLPNCNQSGLPPSLRGRTVEPIWIEPSMVPIDPPTPQPVSASSWQCPGCQTWYAYWVSKCECQKRTMVISGNTTMPQWGTFTGTSL